MEENFVGYLLNALDPETHRQVEAHLCDHPERQRELDLLRQALEPLQADAEEIEPPPGLTVRTLACVAEYCCRDLPRAPAPSRAAEFGPRRWWRRADVLVAASILLCAGLLVPPVVSHFRHQYQLTACQDNLRTFGVALRSYSDNHGGAFPNVGDPKLEPVGVAGIFLPILRETGAVDPERVNVCCPGNGDRAGCPWTLKELMDLAPQKFEELAPRLAGCYAYTLGYRGRDHRVYGYSERSPRVPLMADRPPFRGEGPPDTASNSPNHGGTGQNILFSDGSVKFFTDRFLAGDDIYLNRHNRVGAGYGPEDFVLGISEARP
jgi:hypothetical protein